YDPEIVDVDFGLISAGGEARRMIEVRTREAASLRLLGVASGPDWIAIAPGDEEQTDPQRIVGFLRANTNVPTYGLQGAEVVLATDLPHQPRVVVRARAAIYGTVVPSTNPVTLGLTELGGRAVVDVELRSSQAFEIRAVRDEGK